MHEKGRPGDVDNIHRISKNIMGNTICPLGDAAAMPAISYVTKFRPEFEGWLKNARAFPSEIPKTHIADQGQPAKAISRALDVGVG
jgi:NADH-quinone oxidoreductase subunit F